MNSKAESAGVRHAGALSVGCLTDEVDQRSSIPKSS